MAPGGEDRLKPISAVDVEPPYPLIDQDPHASRVIRYMRPSDYAIIAGMTGAVPLAYYLLDQASSIGHSPKSMRLMLRYSAWVGFAGGFLLAYQKSSYRFWGYEENAQEVKKDMKELSALAAAGKPLYGESDMSTYHQAIAHRNSVFTQLKFSSLPMFNLANHKFHGVDTSKYYPDKPKDDAE